MVDMKIIVYTQPNCNFSKAMIHILEIRGYHFDPMDVSTDDELRERVVAITGQSTLPQLFVGNELVGGYSEFEKLVISGEFEQMLNRDR